VSAAAPNADELYTAIKRVAIVMERIPIFKFINQIDEMEFYNFFCLIPGNEIKRLGAGY